MPTSRIYLADSETDTSRAVNLVMDSSASSRITVTLDGFKATPPDPARAETDPAYRRTVTLALLIKGATIVQLEDLRRSILTYLQLARRAVGQAGGYWTGTPVVLRVALRDSPNYVSFDVTGGVLSEHTRFRGPDTAQFWTLSLECLPYARGPQQTLPAVAATVTSGTSCSVFVDNVPGDVPALAQAIFVDTSDNSEHVNAIRLFRRGRKWMASGDYSPLIAATALSPGSQVNDTAGLDGAHMQSLTCTGAWQACAQIAGGGSGLNDPYADVWIQAKTPNSVLRSPSGLAGTIAMTGGHITENTVHKFAVTCVDGSAHETAATDPITLTIPQVSGANTAEVALTWTDPVVPSDHAIYHWDRGTNTWHRFLTGSTAASYTVLGNESTTTADPPAASDTNLTPPQLRVRVALNTATPEWGPAGDPYPLVLGSSAEWVYAGRFPLPPGARMEGYDSLGWLIKVEGQSLSGSSQTLKIGGAAIVPATEPSIYAERAGLADTTLRRWVIDSRRDGRTAGIVTGTSGPPYTTQGILVPRGQFTLAPGGNMVGVMLWGVGGEANAGHLKGTLQFAVTPRYLDVIGAVS